MRARGKTTLVDYSELYYASTARPPVYDSRLCAVGEVRPLSTAAMRAHDIRLVSAYLTYTIRVMTLALVVSAHEA